MKKKVSMISKSEENLTRRMETRMLFVGNAVGFAGSVTRRCGQLLHHTNGFNRTVYKLDDCNGFSFLSDVGMVGENEVKICYGRGLVLEVSWMTVVTRYSHLWFNENPQWQRELRVLMRRWWKNRVLTIPTTKVLSQFEKEMREYRRAHELKKGYAL